MLCRSGEAGIFAYGASNQFNASEHTLGANIYDNDEYHAKFLLPEEKCSPRFTKRTHYLWRYLRYYANRKQSGAILYGLVSK